MVKGLRIPQGDVSNTRPSYDKISNQYKVYLIKISKEIEPTTFDEASQQPIWCKAMEEELQALEKKLNLGCS
jgi:type III secretory pathway component EscR